jgi:hypothetical protein
MTEKYYKVLNFNGTPCHGGSGAWSLPTGDEPGEWMPLIADIKLCERGYHLCKRGQLMQWLGPAIYEAEWAGAIIEQSDKCVVSQARLIRRLDAWTERAARLFACDCADEALKLVRSPDPRSIEVVRVARRYAMGDASRDQLGAARDAAWDATRDAAWDAAGDAAWAAAWAAARATARDAAWAAARATARDAAWAATRDAAWAAARDAAHAWQTARLFQILEGELYAAE